MNCLCVSYDSNAGYFAAKNEIVQILRAAGDQKAEAELLAPGLLLVKTTIISRKVTEELHERYVNDPESIKATLQWIPVDFLCAPNLADIKSTVREELNFLIIPKDTYKLTIQSVNPKISEKEIRSAALGILRGKEDETAQHEIRIEVYNEQAFVSYLRNKDIFTRGK